MKKAEDELVKRIKVKKTKRKAKASKIKFKCRVVNKIIFSFKCR